LSISSSGKLANNRFRFARASMSAMGTSASQLVFAIEHK
jgi:hypothetical protein